MTISDSQKNRYVIRIIERFTKPGKTLLFANTIDSARAARAGLGRQPKKRIDINDMHPLFTTGSSGESKPSGELQEIAAKLGLALAHFVKEPKEKHI